MGSLFAMVEADEATSRQSKRGSSLAPSFCIKGHLLSVEAIVTAAPMLKKVLYVGNRD